MCPVTNVKQEESKVDKLTRAVEQLAAQVERLQQRDTPDRRRNPRPPLRPFSGKCWNCHRLGHRSRDCTQPDSTDTANLPNCVHSSSVIPTGGYRLSGSVDGVDLSLLLDTGPAVTLLRKDVWEQISREKRPVLRPWLTMKLVTAGGMPLTVHGCASVNLRLGQETFESEVVVASPLTSEAIIGIDFLLKEQAAIDIPAGRLHLRGRGCDVKLKSPAPVNDQVAHYPVCSAETVELPPRSMMQIMGSVKVPTKGVWLLEGPIKKSLPVTVARTPVEPTNTRIPVRVVNPLEEPITVYSGTVLGTLEEVDTPTINVDAVSPGDLNQTVDQVKQEQLWNLVQESGAELNQGQREVFYHLLL